MSEWFVFDIFHRNYSDKLCHLAARFELNDQNEISMNGFSFAMIEKARTAVPIPSIFTSTMFNANATESKVTDKKASFHILRWTFGDPTYQLPDKCLPLINML